MITDTPYQGRRICTVYFYSLDGPLAGHVTEARSVFEACRNALEWFGDTSFWKGPLPTADTILQVRTVAHDQVWYVRVAPGASQQPSLLWL